MHEHAIAEGVFELCTVVRCAEFGIQREGDRAEVPETWTSNFGPGGYEVLGTERGSDGVGLATVEQGEGFVTELAGRVRDWGLAGERVGGVGKAGVGCESGLRLVLVVVEGGVEEVVVNFVADFAWKGEEVWF